MFAIVILFAVFTLFATIFAACVINEDNFSNEHHKFHILCQMLAVCGYVIVTCIFMGSELCGPTKPDLSPDIRELWSEIHTLRAQVVRSEKAAITAQTDSLMAKADSNLADHKSSSANKSVNALAVELKSTQERLEKLEEKLKKQERNGKGSHSKPQVPTGKL